MKNFKQYLPIFVFVLALILSFVSIITSQELAKRKKVAPSAPPYSSAAEITDPGCLGPHPCISGICTSGGSNASEQDCNNTGGGWVYTCCEVANYCGDRSGHSLTCGGECVYDAGGGDWQWQSCGNVCPPQTHKICQNNACATVSGSGTDSCSTDADCTTPTHKACQNNACATVTGAGTDSCTSDTDCLALKCNSVTLSPSSTTITSASQAISLTAVASGGVLPLSYTWALTSSGADKGILSAQTGSTVTWTAPATLPTANQTWSIAATAKDANNNSDSSGCIVNLAFSLTPTHKICQNNACATIAGSGTDSCSSDRDCLSCDAQCNNNNDCPSNLICNANRCRASACVDKNDCNCTTTLTHKTCQNSACVTINGSGTDNCSSDVDCQPKSTPPPVPQSGSGVPTIVTAAAGVILLLLGALAL